MASLIEQQIRTRASALLAEGRIDGFVGYRQGSGPLRVAPFVARAPAEVEKLVWNPVCVPNLAGALRKHAGQRVGVALKACDARSVVELLRLRQLDRKGLYLIGVPCRGMLDPEKVAAAAAGRVTGLVEEGAEVVIGVGGETLRYERAGLLLTKCAGCPAAPAELFDETLEEGVPAPPPGDRFAAVRALEALEPAERLAFWQQHFSRCTLCYACQTVCPLCFCKECALALERDDPRRLAREPASVFAFHLMRAYHLAERCTGCDECERVCPEDIPLSLICRKLELDRLE
ncbi:MAG: 4Fe-4S dicluster domain-containing protein [Chloroflexaceae bacterium]|nr:4Fe-4S dicluster domain-containing protein [Chloroflexaceae bacterium]